MSGPTDSPWTWEETWALTQALSLPNPPEILIAHWEPGGGDGIFIVFVGRRCALTLLISCRSVDAPGMQANEVQMQNAGQ